MSIRSHLLEDVVVERINSNAGQVCTVITNGKNVSIEWYGPNGQQPLISTSRRNDYMIGGLSYTDSETHQMSILTISNLTRDSFGQYECRINVDGHVRNNYFDVSEKTGISYITLYLSLKTYIVGMICYEFI